jgi:oxygen-independent coproporphyrinogen-3 oxidase
MLPGIYIHLPFCAVHCSYCDFPLTTRLSLSDRYYAALLKEIRKNRPAEVAETLYFGGGTPSLTPPATLAEIMSEFLLLPGAEVTLEANPDDVTLETVKLWKQLGVTRLSIGVQSLDQNVLKWMLRRHSAEEGVASLASARSAGMKNVNVDLMMGCPGQTAESFLSGLKRLIEFRPEHFSLYLLEMHEGTALEEQLKKGKIDIMPDEDQIECFNEGRRLLGDAGYFHYEVSNFALPGYESRHNLKYWSDAPYYAFGAGASSYVRSIRATNIRSVAAYITAIEEGGDAIEMSVIEDADTRMRNALIFGLRKMEGVNIGDFRRSYGIQPIELFGEAGEEYLRGGFLEMNDTHLRLSPAGVLVSNEILSRAV